MSLAIPVQKVHAILLADGWHRGASFDLDSYEFVDGDSGWALHGGGQSGVCATGFTFEAHDGRISGPLTAILAVMV